MSPCSVLWETLHHIQLEKDWFWSPGSIHVRYFSHVNEWSMCFSSPIALHSGTCGIFLPGLWPHLWPWGTQEETENHMQGCLSSGTSNGCWEDLLVSSDHEVRKKCFLSFNLRFSFRQQKKYGVRRCCRARQQLWPQDSVANVEDTCKWCNFSIAHWLSVPSFSLPW